MENNIKMENFLYPKCEDVIYYRESYIEDHSINITRMNQYISMFKEDEKKNIQYIFENVIQHISWAEFKKHLLDVGKETLEILGDKDFQYVLPLDEHKSNYFFSAIVNEEVFIPNEKYAKPIADIKVYIDDMSYSGSQLLQMIKQIIPVIKIKNYTDDINPTDKDKLIFSYVRFIIDEHTLKMRYQKNLNIDEYILMVDSKNKGVLITKNKIIQFENTADNFLMLKELTDSLSSVNNKYPDLKQLKYVELDMLESSHQTIILCIPYLSKKAYDSIQKLNDIHSKGVHTSMKITIPKGVNIIPNIDNNMLHSESFFPYNIDYASMTAVYFDHKLASPVSTICVILGCGIIPSELSKSGKVKSIGNLLNNCSKEYFISEDVKAFSEKFYNHEDEEYDPESDEKACISCPRPVYKYDNCDFKFLQEAKDIKKMGFSFSGYVGDKSILIEE